MEPLASPVARSALHATHGKFKLEHGMSRSDLSYKLGKHRIKDSAG